MGIGGENNGATFYMSPLRPCPEPVGPDGRTPSRRDPRLFGYRETTVADAEALEAWLRDQAAVVGAVPDHLVARLKGRCRELAIEPPSGDCVDRIVKAAIRAHDDRLYAGIRGRLTLATRDRLGALLQSASGTSDALHEKEGRWLVPPIHQWQFKDELTERLRVDETHQRACPRGRVGDRRAVGR